MIYKQSKEKCKYQYIILFWYFICVMKMINVHNTERNYMTMLFPFYPQSEHFMVLMFIQEYRVEITRPFVREDA